VSHAVQAMKMTRVLIAHRKETIATADRVVALEPGLGVLAGQEAVAA
jgi:ATP-binding cassette subfamily B protein RaxB